MCQRTVWCDQSVGIVVACRCPWVWRVVGQKCKMGDLNCRKCLYRPSARYLGMIRGLRRLCVMLFDAGYHVEVVELMCIELGVVLWSILRVDVCILVQVV